MSIGKLTAYLTYIFNSIFFQSGHFSIANHLLALSCHSNVVNQGRRGVAYASPDTPEANQLLLLMHHRAQRNTVTALFCMHKLTDVPNCLVSV